MPKMKTHSGLKKRVKKTKSGKVKISHSHRVHLLHAKNKNAKRAHRKANFVDKSDMKRIKQQVANIK
ncbi:MAG: 50S ribosomal protein L35 [Candidatus Izimaplasma sp.]|nr:50S ribosomal protein L35 [Candidatus Izimaplasma bacterium]